MENEILKKLYEPFDVKTKPGSGNYKYIKSSDAIDRVNKTFVGNWNTEVINTEIIEDNVIVRILVTVYPPGDGPLMYGPLMSYKHEGIGSAPIKRFNSGTNAGKPINIGSDYKAASSMAIRNACSRWGVGLHLEEGHTDSFDIVEESKASIPTPAPAPAPPSPVDVPPPPKPPTFPEVKVEPEVPEVKAPPVIEEPKVELPPMPPFPEAPSPSDVVKDSFVPKPPPVSKDDGNFPKIPMPTQPPPSQPDSSDSDMISDVQKAALNGLLTIRGLEYNKLVTDAFKEKNMEVGSSVPTVEALTYKQAVVIIKYGNDLFKKKN